MVRATEKAGVSSLLATDRVPAMAANIQQNMDPVVFAAAYDYRLSPNIGGAVITWLGNLTLVSYIDPNFLKDPEQLVFKNLWVRVDFRAYFKSGWCVYQQMLVGIALHVSSRPFLGKKTTD